MVTIASTPAPRGLALMLGWKRVVLALGISGLLGLVISPSFTTTPAIQVMAREMVVGLATLIAFGIFEQWPARLPNWIARWVLQIAAIEFVVPFAVLAVYMIITAGDPVPFWKSEARVTGFFTMTITGLLLAPWIAVAAIFHQREIERGELERKALDSRLRLLQAQVEPHFLFNTLANVRELVDSGSPQASKVLDTLITYLRGVVPRLQDQASTLEQEVQMVRAYLELMHMRMPDRLEFAFDVDAAALPLRCPPTTLLTLVENAVRHGIDPSERGGRIDVRVGVKDGRCRAQVIDTGVGLKRAGDGLGTGLSTLRERLHLAFGADAKVELAENIPHGVRVELDFPAQASPK